MIRRALEGLRVLVVEDEYMLANDLEIELSNAGAVVIGPAGSVKDALALVQAESRLDGAVLDTNLRDGMVFPVADLLRLRQVPFVFTTGYGLSAIPEAYRGFERCEKPFGLAQLTRIVGRVIHK